MLTNQDIIKYIDDPSNDPLLIYNLREHDYVPNEIICLHILKNEFMNYVNMITEYDITDKLAEIIIQIYHLNFLQNKFFYVDNV